MNYFSTIFGLITKHDQTTENGGLFFAYCLTLKVTLGSPITVSDKIIYLEKMYNARVEKGLYRRSSRHNERTVSHDELTGMIVSSKILKTWHGGEIVEFLEGHYGSYPATGVAKFYQPSNFYMWGLLTGRRWTAIFFPLYFTSMMISIGKEKETTSSKLIYFVELYHAKDLSLPAKFLWSLYVTNMKNQYGDRWVSALFATYFHTEESDHPLISLSRKVESLD